jgi:hypothetical protein
VDANLAVLRFGDALDADRGQVVATPEDQEAAVVQFLFPIGIEHRGLEVRDPLRVLRVDRDVEEPRDRRHQAPTSSSAICPKTSVCRSTSSAVVAGDISAMLWNGVMRTPRFNR